MHVISASQDLPYVLLRVCSQAQKASYNHLHFEQVACPVKVNIRWEQRAHPLFCSDEDDLLDPSAVGSEEIQVGISNYKGLIRTDAQLLQRGKKGFWIGLKRAIVPTNNKVEREIMTRKDPLHATARVIGDQGTLNLGIS